MNEHAHIFNQVSMDYPDYLRDESRLTGQADSISFPANEEAVKNLLVGMARDRLPVTVQAGRTGITGGAVPDGGHILNLSHMNRIPGLRYDPAEATYFLRVQPGVILADIRKVLASRVFDMEGWSAESCTAAGQFAQDRPYFFPPDPTETSAAIGGMAACNASGARSFHFGATRRYIEQARLVLADGAVLTLKRGMARCQGRRFEIQPEEGRTISGTIPAYTMPEVKNASGYFARENMDVLDLFIGSEGTLGVFSELELRLVPVPRAWWGVMAFFPSEEGALSFVEDIRRKENRPAAIEFFDRRALNLLRRQKAVNPAFGELPDMPADWHTGIYVEYAGESEEAVEAAVMEMSEIMTTCGGGEESTWLASDAREMERLKTFRHALPESVNLLIDERRKQDSSLTKLGTDLAVPDGKLRDMMALYHRDLDAAGLEHVIFGHIGNNHVHVNIIPGNREEYERGKALYLTWARTAVEWGGSISAEHGVGKIKRELLKEMYGAAGIRQMMDLKKIFDPAGLLNPGNLFEI